MIFDFVIPIRGYADTVKKLRSFFLIAVVLSCIYFVKFCQTGDLLLREYPDTHYKMTISYPCIRFFVFVARIALPRGRAIRLFLTPVRIRGRQKSLFSYPNFAKKPTPTLTLQRGIK